MLTFCAFLSLGLAFLVTQNLTKKGWNGGHMVPFSHWPLLLCSHHAGHCSGHRKGFKNGLGFFFYVMCSMYFYFFLLFYRLWTLSTVKWSLGSHRGQNKNEHSCGSQSLYVLASCLWAVNSQIFPGIFMWITFIGTQRKACKKCWGRGGGKNTISVFVFSNLSNSQPPFCGRWGSGHLQWPLTLNTRMSNCFKTYPCGAFPITVRLKVKFTQKWE